MRQEAKEYPFPLGNRLYILLGLYSRAITFLTPSEEKEDYSACMLRKAEQTLLNSTMLSSIKHKQTEQSISWTFLNDAMAISAQEMPKNHTDKERFAAALCCIQTGILTLLFPLKRRRSSPSPFISHRVLEAVASRDFSVGLSAP